MAGGAQAKKSTWLSKPNQSLISKVTKKKGRIQSENFCVCAPEKCPLQGGAESWTYWATIYLQWQVFFHMAGGAQAKMSTWLSKPNQSLISKVTKKKGRIQPENFCVCAPENCPLQGGGESWTYWATI